MEELLDGYLYELTESQTLLLFKAHESALIKEAKDKGYQLSVDLGEYLYKKKHEINNRCISFEFDVPNFSMEVLELKKDNKGLISEYWELIYKHDFYNDIEKKECLINISNIEATALSILEKKELIQSK